MAIKFVAKNIKKIKKNLENKIKKMELLSRELHFGKIKLGRRKYSTHTLSENCFVIVTKSLAKIMI